MLTVDSLYIPSHNCVTVGIVH